MFAVAALLTLVNSVSGTPYVTGGDSPPGPTARAWSRGSPMRRPAGPIYGDRFNTGNIEQALLARGFQYGTQPGALIVGWNGGHTAATLPDGTPVSSGESGGVKVGGGGAYQSAVQQPHVPADARRPAAAARVPAPRSCSMGQQGPMPPAPPMAPPPPPPPGAPMAPPPALDPIGAAPAARRRRRRRWLLRRRRPPMAPPPAPGMPPAPMPPA